MAGRIYGLEEFPTSMNTFVMKHPLRLTAWSHTELPDITEKLADDEKIPIPIATYELGLIPGLNRGLKLSNQIPGGVKAYVVRDVMTRAPLVSAANVGEAIELAEYVKNNFEELRKVAESLTDHGKLLELEPSILGSSVYLRLVMQTGEASGHNMTTEAGTEILRFLLNKFPGIKYVSDSGNMCVDKKSAAINAIKGRGKHVITEMYIPGDVLAKFLTPKKSREIGDYVTAEQIKDLHIKKNLEGSMLAGGMYAGNAHYNNIIQAMFNATGQDIANGPENSLGINQVEVVKHDDPNKRDDLIFRTNHYCLIVGTVGCGKGGESQQRSLGMMDCLQEDKPEGYNSQRLSTITAGATAVGEVNLIAVQTKMGNLIDSHKEHER